MIPRSRLEREPVCNQYGEGYLYSSYAHHAADNDRFLKKVFSKEIPFVSALYSMMANTVELHYKAIIMACAEQNNERVPRNIEHEHYLPTLEKYICDHYYDCKSIDRNDSDRNMDLLIDLSSGYKDSRYADRYEFQDFTKDYRQVEKLIKPLYIEFGKYVSMQKGKE